eukprot:jgi/Orpsp1_1/1184868/evm.model.c7180000091325.1
MLYKKNIRNLFLAIIIFGKIKHSLQLDENHFKVIVHDDPDILECYRVPEREEYCSIVKDNMIAL